MNSGLPGSHNGPLGHLGCALFNGFLKGYYLFSLIQNTNKESHEVFPSHFPSPTLTRLWADPPPSLLPSLPLSLPVCAGHFRNTLGVSPVDNGQEAKATSRAGGRQNLSSGAAQTVLPATLSTTQAQRCQTPRSSLRVLGSDPHPGLSPYWQQQLGSCPLDMTIAGLLIRPQNYRRRSFSHKNKCPLLNLQETATLICGQ
jgi:hypothetical protein